METTHTQEDENEQGGLVFAYIFDGKGGGKEIGWDEVHAWQPQEGYFLWLHLNYTNPKVQQWLEKDSGLDSISVNTMMMPDVRPRIIDSNNGLIVLLRTVNKNPGADPEDMLAIRIWVDHSRVITTRHRKILSITDMNEIIHKGKAPISPSNFLATLIDFSIDRMADVIEQLSELTDDLEEEVLTAEPYSLRPKISNFRRQVISIRRFLAPERDTLARLYIEDSRWVTKPDRLHIREATDRITYYLENLDESRERANVTHEELTSRITEQMDRRMFWLSMVAVIFLPLSFITGLFGINVGGIPGIQSHIAFPIISISLIAIAIIEILYFRRKKWI